MISIAGSELNAATLLEEYPLRSVERKVLVILSSSDSIYRYDNIDQLRFELGMRSNIVSASKKLHNSGLKFRIFRNSACNEDYWKRTDEGGFLLKESTEPSDGMEDIFRNGYRYGTECATAIVMVFYKAALDSLGTDQFNRKYRSIYLMNWKSDYKLGVDTYRNPPDYLPGDCRYFKNPDVDPLTPEWQGENAIDLSDGKYYGHGIGITYADNIIAALNENRVDESTVSAYLTETATRPDYKMISMSVVSMPVISMSVVSMPVVSMSRVSMPATSMPLARYECD